MPKHLSSFLKLGIVGLWIVLLSVLFYRHYISGTTLSPIQKVSGKEFKTKEEWFGVYLKGEKLGHVKTSLEKIGEEYRFINISETTVKDKDKVIHTRTELRCLTDLDYRIKSFDFDSESEGNRLKAHGEMKGDLLVMFTEVNGQRRAVNKTLDKQPYFPLTVKAALFEQGMEKGKRFKIPILDIMSFNVIDETIEVEELIPVKVGIRVNTAYLLRVGKNHIWLSDGGLTLKEEYQSGLLLISEPEDVAKTKEARVFDFLSLPVIETNKQLPNHEKLSYAKFRISGINLSEFNALNGGRQALKGDVLEIRRENEEEFKKQTYDLPYKGTDLEAYLQPTPFVQSDHRTIIYNSKKFVIIEKNSAFRLARYLTSNLYLTIRKHLFARIPTAMDVFKSRAGDSNEHTVLFTAFARAGGLPTRMVAGLVYMQGRFYYHTWPEVWLGEWIAVDPTLAQFPADATHIRLMEGDMDKLTSLGRLVTQMKIDIIEAK
ncbi:MAG: transglutaminase domain-containing protein [Nitrospirae bacterium]|nr:transglutaminase domain-containing protein [Nitrospirota bacterium]